MKINLMERNCIVFSLANESMAQIEICVGGTAIC